MYTFKNIDDPKIEKCPKTKVVRSFFCKSFLVDKPSNYNKFKHVEDICLNFLKDNEKYFNLSNITYKQISVCEGSKTKSVTYQQIHNGVTVENYIVVGVNKETLEVISTINQVDYEIPNDLGKERRLEAKDALDIVSKLTSKYTEKIQTGDPSLRIYKHASLTTNYNQSEINKYIYSLTEIEEKDKENKNFLVWQILLDVKSEYGYWEFLVDANDGKIVNVRDRRQYNESKYISCPGKAFIPDPITSSQNKDLHPTDLKTPEETEKRLYEINQELKPVILSNLELPIKDIIKLNGRWIKSEDKLFPQVTPPKTTEGFIYEYKQPEFQSVMAYYWTDTFIEYLRQFNVIKYNERVEAVKITIDAQANESSFNLSVKEGPYILFDESDVPDATDAHVVIHEYCHAIHWYMEKQQSLLPFGIEEGIADFLAGVWLDRFNKTLFNRREAFPWANNTKINGYDPERVFDITKKFSDLEYSNLNHPNAYGTYVKGSILATALWNTYLLMGGADLKNLEMHKTAADKLIYMYLEMLISIAPNVTVEQLVKGLINTDQQLFGGENRDHITKAFHNQGLTL
ncbi:MAG: M36 family metallopeptidase [Blastocatellia bacterium]